jgi:hypothetical protein
MSRPNPKLTQLRSSLDALKSGVARINQTALIAAPDFSREKDRYVSDLENSYAAVEGEINTLTGQTSTLQTNFNAVLAQKSAAEAAKAAAEEKARLAVATSTETCANVNVSDTPIGDKFKINIPVYVDKTENETKLGKLVVKNVRSIEEGAKLINSNISAGQIDTFINEDVAFNNIPDAKTAFTSAYNNKTELKRSDQVSDAAKTLGLGWAEKLGRDAAGVTGAFTRRWTKTATGDDVKYFIDNSVVKNYGTRDDVPSLYLNLYKEVGRSPADWKTKMITGNDKNGTPQTLTGAQVWDMLRAEETFTARYNQGYTGEELLQRVDAAFQTLFDKYSTAIPDDYKLSLEDLQTKIAGRQDYSYPVAKPVVSFKFSDEYMGGINSKFRKLYQNLGVLEFKDKPFAPKQAIYAASKTIFAPSWEADPEGRFAYKLSDQKSMSDLIKTLLTGDRGAGKAGLNAISGVGSKALASIGQRFTRRAPVSPVVAPPGAGSGTPATTPATTPAGTTAPGVFNRIGNFFGRRGGGRRTHKNKKSKTQKGGRRRGSKKSKKH